VLLYCNGIDYEAQDKLALLDFECLPTGGWGYETLSMGARYLRTLGKPVLNMSGRFHKSWGDFGGIRTEPSLEYDMVYGMANAMRPNIGDHFHPRGDITSRSSRSTRRFTATSSRMSRGWTGRPRRPTRRCCGRHPIRATSS